MERLNSKSFRYRRAVILVGIMALAFGVRIIGIGRESLWLDEGVSAMRAFQDTVRIWQSTAHGDYNPPGYYYALHYWIMLAGQEEGAMRSLSAILSTLSVWLVYRIGKELMCRSAAIFAALLTAISLYHLRYAQELRPYALFGFTALLSLLFLLKLCRRYRGMTAAGYVLSTAATLYSHPYAIFQWLAQNLFFVLGRLFYRDFVRVRWRQWILLQGLIVLLFSPWLWVMFHIVRHIENTRPIQWVPRWVDLPGAFKAFAGDNAAGGLLLIILILMSVLLTPATFKKPNAGNAILSFRKPSGREMFLWLWLLCPILIPYLMSHYSAPIFQSRYMIAASFACYLLAAAGIMRIRPVLLKGAAATAIITLFLFTLIPYYSQTHKEQWRDAASYIEQRAKPGDLLLFNSGYCQSCVYWYYAKRTDLPIKGFPIQGDPRVVTEADVRRQFPSLIGDHNHIWLILSHSFDREGIILRYLTEQYDIRDRKIFNGIEIYGLEKRL
jgi:uncharacterized membrane protein